MDAEFEEQVVADANRDRAIEQVFHNANARVGAISQQIGLPLLPLNFNPPPDNRNTPAALGDPPSAIALYLQVLKPMNIDLEVAAGILAHEYGHLYYWQSRPASGNAASVEAWELAADRFSGWVLATVGLTTTGIEAFVTALSASREDHVDYQSRIMAIREGFLNGCRL